MMLTVTPGAGARLMQKLARKGVPDEVAMRFLQKTNGWRLRLDHARPADTAITHKGRIVLLLDERVSQAMSDMTLDVRTTETGPRLALR